MQSKFSRGLVPASLVSLAAAVFTLAGCGGGGDDAGAPLAGPTPEGAYSGTLTGSASNAFQLLVLENNEYWALYGTTSGSTFNVAGFMQGTGTANNGSFTSSNAKDFGVAPPPTGSVSATYVAGTSIQGTVSFGGQVVSLSGAAIPSSTFDYSAAASLAAITGNWSLTALGGAAASLAIASNGDFTGSSAGCSFTGSLAPRATGKNVFNFSVTFDTAPCALPNQSGTGVAISYLVSGTATRQLIIAGVNGARSAGTALVGTR